jgi:hypothetical protein
MFLTSIPIWQKVNSRCSNSVDETVIMVFFPKCDGLSMSSTYSRLLAELTYRQNREMQKLLSVLPSSVEVLVLGTQTLLSNVRIKRLLLKGEASTLR